MSDYSPISFPHELAKKIAPLIRADRSNKRQFVIECVEAICELIETPRGERVVPMMVNRITAAIQREPLPEDRSEQSRREDLGKLGAAFPSSTPASARKALVETAASKVSTAPPKRGQKQKAGERSA